MNELSLTYNLDKNVFLHKTINLAKKYKFRILTDKYSLNIIGARNESKRSDRFDDFIVAFRWVDKLEGYIFEATTDAGAYYLLNPLKAQGTAILCPNIQVKEHYKLVEKGHKGYKAFKQIKPFPYIRDNNRDTILNFELFTDNCINNIIIGANLHRASKNLILNTIGKYSAGCQVIRKPKDWNLLIKLGDEQVKYTNIDTFDYGILWIKDILNESI